MHIQISMNVLSTLTAVLTTAPIPLDPMYAVVGLDTGWPPMDTLVKVNSEQNYQSLFYKPLSFFQTSMSVASTLMVVLTFVPTPLGPTHAAVEPATDCSLMDTHALVFNMQDAKT